MFGLVTICFKLAPFDYFAGFFSCRRLHTVKSTQVYNLACKANRVCWTKNISFIRDYVAQGFSNLDS